VNLMFWRRRDADETGTAADLVLEQLSAYLDGELTEAETAEIESLVAPAAAAAEVLGDLRLVRSAFGALGEVRAPRSFAIAVDAGPRPASATVSLFRRTETFIRASAAVAALFFLVAVVNDPGGSTPVARQDTSLAFETASLSAAEDGPAVVPAGQTEKGEADIGTTGLAAPAPSDGDDGAGDDSPQGGAPLPGAGGSIPEGAPMGGGVDGPPADVQAEDARNTEELRPLAAGTELLVDSSQDVGGMALALGVLAGLLTALSALTAWARRSDSQAR
jgi:hypothetical protein